MTAPFPFATYRAGQREAIDRARDAFRAGKRFVVIEAPTGAGKSAMAIALAREANSAYILTAQKILQDQYFRDFPDLAIMKGRANYDCLVAPTHAAAAPCIAGRRFPQCDACPYFRAKDAAIGADGTIMNYAYYLAELNHAGGFGRRDLLVLDEAHGAEAALMGFVQVSVSDAALERAGVEASIPPALDGLGLFDFAEDLAPLLIDRSHALEEQLREGELGQTAAIQQMQVKQWCDQQVTRLELLRDSRYEDFVEWTQERVQGAEGASLTFKPVTVASFAESHLFRHGERVLMMSATILDAPTFLRGLGVAPEDAEVVSLPSAFPPENRPIVVRPSARLTRHWLDRELPKLAHEVGEILSAHPDEKGVIHAHSYRIARYLEDHVPPSQRARVVTHHSAAGRDAALLDHVTRDAPTVLLTPSMTEGIDLADDLSRWQVICKIPYPYLGDPQIAARKSIDPGWYDWRTCLTIVQGYGRSVRSADDHAVTYVLDADFPKFLDRQRHRFPPWFVEAVQG